MMTRFSDPLEALLAIQHALEAHRDSDWMASSTTGTGSFPPINIFQRGDDFVAILEVPGIEKADLRVEAKQNAIRISGRKNISYDEGASIHRRERIWGAFDRTLSVPIQIDPDAVKAEYHDGILAIFIPRAESDKPKTIKIT